MTPQLAAAPDAARTQLWWASLGAGLVVIVCVIILLSLLFTFVRDIDRHLRCATSETRGSAEHLSETHLIVSAARLIEHLGTELALQVAVLTRDGGEQG